MTVTVTTPRGSKVRSASHRRFLVVRESVLAADNSVQAASIDKRSDNLETARAHARRSNDRASRAGASFAVFTVLDTRTGEVAR